MAQLDSGTLAVPEFTRAEGPHLGLSLKLEPLTWRRFDDIEIIIVAPVLETVKILAPSCVLRLAGLAVA